MDDLKDWLDGNTDISTVKDPFSILGQDNSVQTELGVEGTATFHLADFGAVLQAVILYAGVVVMLGIAISMLFLRNNDKVYGERKAGIQHRLIIVFLGAFAVTIFNLFKMILDGAFGF